MWFPYGLFHYSSLSKNSSFSGSFQDRFSEILSHPDDGDDVLAHLC